MLAGGRIVASGSPAELMAAASPSLRVRLDPPLEPAELEGLGRAIGGSVVAIEPGRYRIDGVAPSPATIATLTAWCAAADRRVVELTTVGGSLEDAYLELVGRA